MAGGIFGGRPFTFNIKCIIFSLLCMALFLLKPQFKSNWALAGVLFLIFVLAYVAMAWYDYYFNCDVAPLQRGSSSLTGKLKPPGGRNCEFKEDRSAKRILIYIFHLLFIVPLLLYVAISKDESKKWVYPLLIVLAVFTALYHGVYLMFSSHHKYSPVEVSKIDFDIPRY